jgi:hypothetical protein
MSKRTGNSRVREQKCQKNPKWPSLFKFNLLTSTNVTKEQKKNEKRNFQNVKLFVKNQ